MPQQRKTAATAAARDDARAGKAAAAAAGGGTIARGGAAAGGGGGGAGANDLAATTSSSSLPYTSEEVSFLQTHLKQLSALQAGGSGGGGGDAQAWRDAWPSMLPLLTSIVGKALKLAEDNYTPRPRGGGAAAAPGGAGGATTTAAAAAAAAATTVATFSNGIGMDSVGSSGGGGSARDSLGKSTTVSGTSATLRDCAGGDASTNASSVQPLSHAQFVDENAYLLEQLQQLPYTPFTMVRLLEILSNPLQYHRNAEGKLRGDMLQASLRRCLLVSFPAFASSAAGGEGM